MDKIEESIRRVFEVNSDTTAVNNFARGKYYDHFRKNKVQEGAWRAYRGFEVLSPSSIRVKYMEGAGDMEYPGDFIVNI